MKKASGKARGTSLSRLVAQKVAALEGKVLGQKTKSVKVSLEESVWDVLEGLASATGANRTDLAQELLTASIQDLARMVSSRVGSVAVQAAD